MARLIVKSPYIKCGGDGCSEAGGYLKYIATRERVQIIADDRPPTRRQEQLIRHLLRDFPDVKELDEYDSYEAAHTKRAASALISMALEMNWPEANRSEIYLKYIAVRPRAERIGEHGLFGDEDGVDLEKAMAELENYQGNVWTHIISLKRENAARLGYDSANAWRDLIRTHRNDIAAAMQIPPDDFRWYAAFHDEGDHPHIHMMAWSVKPGQAYLSKEGIRKIKSELTNDIFRQEMLHIYEKKSESRNELVRQVRREMRKLAREMRQSLCSHPEVEKLMAELSQKLETVKGKKSYGYLPKNLKPLVDRIVDEMERLPVVAECYGTWWKLQCQVNDFYSEHPDNPYMFPSSTTGEMYYPDSVVKLHEKILKDAGLEHIRFHDLRHTFATLALQNGVDIKTVSSMLGHYDAGFTLRTYTHATRQMQDQAAEAMGNFMAQVM